MSARWIFWIAPSARAVETGSGSFNDNDLAPLHAYPRFQQIVAKLG